MRKKENLENIGKNFFSFLRLPVAMMLSSLSVTFPLTVRGGQVMLKSCHAACQSAVFISVNANAFSCVINERIFVCVSAGLFIIIGYDRRAVAVCKSSF